MITSMENYELAILYASDGGCRLQMKRTEDGRHYVDPVTEFGWLAWKLAKSEVLCPECDSFNFSTRAVDDDCGTECECRDCANIWRI